jgi:hypothetical protein
MPDTVDDFMKRFGTEGTIDDREAQKYHDRFVSTDDKDRDFDNDAYHQGATEYLGKLPDDQFQQAARTAVSQAPPQEREGLLGGLLSALGGGAMGGSMGNRSGGGGGIADMLGGLVGGGGGGLADMIGGLAGGNRSGGAAGGIGDLAKMLGLGTTDPRQMSEDDAAKLMNYARKENPEALRQTVQEKPWLMKAMGNPVVMGALTMAAAKLLSNRRR